MIKCFDNIFYRLIINSWCFRGGVMKAAAETSCYSGWRSHSGSIFYITFVEYLPVFILRGPSPNRRRSGVDRISASLNALSWASGLGKLTTIPTQSSRAGVACLACFQKQLFAMWMWRLYWISLHTLIDSRLFAWDVSADHQPLREGSGLWPNHLHQSGQWAEGGKDLRQGGSSLPKGPQPILKPRLLSARPHQPGCEHLQASLLQPCQCLEGERIDC